jgi:hypothetical protein
VPLSGEQSALTAKLKHGKYGEVAGGDENVADTKPAAVPRPTHQRRRRRASDDLWQIDPTAMTRRSRCSRCRRR